MTRFLLTYAHLIGLVAVMLAVFMIGRSAWKDLKTQEKLAGARRWRRHVATVPALLVIVAALVGIGCTIANTTTTGPTDIDITQPNPQASPGGTGGNGSDTLPSGSTVRVGIFGMSCPAGTTVPTNGQRQIPAGCVAYLTATPKGADGTDLSPTVHGPNCAWSSFGPIQLSPATEKFNQDARCPAPGDATVTATVKGTSGSVGLACLAGRAALGAPVFYWFSDDPTLYGAKRDAIVRTLDAYELEQSR
jgi:hypothetical protein